MRRLITNIEIVNEGRRELKNVLIDADRISALLPINSDNLPQADEIIDGRGKMMFPGVIDDQVHFRDPGLTQKADIASESAAAVAGGVTSFMDMPNVNPQTTTNQLLNERTELASQKSLANFAFYLGATNNNIDEIRKADTRKVCGIKVFMGSSTGNMLVDEQNMLESIFAESPCMVAVHCEDEQIIKANLELYRSKYGDNVLPAHHPLIRTAEACYKSTAKAVELATKHNTRLHIAHLSTAKELEFFSTSPLNEKKITAETCPHYLYFNSRDYDKFGYRIKCNPAIKNEEDKLALIAALNSGKIDTIATDHAPHLPSEKFGETYFKSASGMPTIQHSLIVMLELCKKGKLNIETIVQKMCHAPANLYRIEKRGYLNAGYKADITIVDFNQPQTITTDNILYKCKWTPFENQTFNSTVTHTFVNGNLIYCNGKFVSEEKGKALIFER